MLLGWGTGIRTPRDGSRVSRSDIIVNQPHPEGMPPGLRIVIRDPCPFTATPTAIPNIPPSAPNLILGELVYDSGVSSVESDEYIEVINNGAPINLSGWLLRDDDGNAFKFPSYDMDAGSLCRVYTNEIHPDWCGFSFGSGKAIWGNSGDQVELVNPAGVMVDTACWKSGC